jgi:hypothetical protein
MVTHLEAVVSPRNEGRFVGTWASSSTGGRTGRCTKWDEARSMICFWSCENESRLDHQVSRVQDSAGMVGAGKAGKTIALGSEWHGCPREEYLLSSTIDRYSLG